MIGYAIRQSSNWIMLCVVVLLLSGCLGQRAPKVTYFSLLNMEQLGEVDAGSSLSEVRLGIGPVTIPDSLKRSQIATRQHGNQYEFDEYHRWAGVLERDFAVVLGDNLGVLLSADKVGFFPWTHRFKPSYRVVVDVIRLDGALDGEAILSARWAVTDAKDKEFLASGKSDYRQALDDGSFAALIKAESLLVGELSREIAVAIVALEK